MSAPRTSRGVSPVRVLQSVASGLLGRDAYAGGVPTAALGLALHFFIATTAAAVFVEAASAWPMLIRRPVLFGITYGLVVFVVMQWVVLPLSAFRPGPFSWPAFVNGTLIHALGVGLPIALMARRFVRPPPGRQ